MDLDLLGTAFVFLGEVFGRDGLGSLANGASFALGCEGV